MSVRASILIAADAVVGAGDYLAHAGNGTSRPTSGPDGAFAVVIDPTPGERTAKGYPVKCELLLKRQYQG